MFIQLFERRHKVLLTRLSGTFDQDDITALYAAAKRTMAREGPALRSLQDFSAVQAVDMQVARIAQHGWRPQVVPERQRIMVVPQPETRIWRACSSRIRRSPALTGRRSCGLWKRLTPCSI